MSFDELTITKELLIELQKQTGYTHQEIADLLGISKKSWQNRISYSPNLSLKKSEYELLLLHANQHPDYQLTKRKKPL